MTSAEESAHGRAKPSGTDPKNSSGSDKSPLRRATLLLLALAAVVVVGAALAWWLATSGMGETIVRSLAPERPGRAIGMIMFIAAGVVFGSAAAYWQTERYIAALLLVAPYLPGLAATLTVITYLTIGPSDPSCSQGRKGEDLSR